MSADPKANAKDKNAYKQTLNLPQTAFSMEAKLVQNEPARLKQWQDSNLYQRILAARAKGRKWLLHDGPPFANGDIHIGHVLNKTLKDVILRFRTMQGYLTPYVPGWDCHGLPIEQKIQDEVGPKLREMTPVQVRALCHAHASKYIDIQREQFKRLGVLGEWERPYLTMAPEYEACSLDVFAQFVERGLVYKKLKPVHWSIANQTALADADVEYKDIEGPSVYVEFRAADDDAVRKVFGVPAAAAPQEIYFLVWTTTPWTLPANLAIAAHPEIKYALVRYTRKGLTRLAVVAEPLVEQVFKRSAIEQFEKLANAVDGSALAVAHLQYRHNFVERVSPIVNAEYVTTTDGTGLVHTAPGHGVDDYGTGLANGLPIYSPVMHNGLYDDTVPEWLRRMHVWKADPAIIKRLDETHFLLDQGKIVHSYPHDERSKTPTIFRATEQWFIAVDKPFLHPADPAGAAPRTLRERAVALVGTEDQSAESWPSTSDGRQPAPDRTVDFIPAWGRNRIGGMLASRPDWCISRQRAWGLPIPVFYNERNEALCTPESVRAVAKHFAKKGSDSWFTDSPRELLGADFVCPPGFNPDTLRKEKDIFDVWFESGSSWHAVLQARDYLGFPADLYLEGSDQHRGWFQLSMLPSLGATAMAPFRQVLTHGFVVGPDGRKKSKRDKDYVTATEEVNRHGADLLRLWCASVDYQGDVPVSPQMLKDFGDKYRKIRNTLKYLLSNLYDYTPATDAVEIPQQSLDGWISAELDQLIIDVTAAYDSYTLHRAFRLMHDFCAVQISAIYGNAMKDRLYCDAPNSPLRRRCQTVMHRMVLALTKLLAPVLVFTADEVWQHIPHKPADDAACDSVHLALLPQPSSQQISDAQREEWKLLMDLRDAALAQLDALKKEVGLNKALDAEIVYQLNDDDLRRRLQAYGPDMEDIVGAGSHSYVEKELGSPAAAVKVLDRRETYKACARSWKRRPDVGDDPQYPDLTLRDAAVVKAMKS